MKGLLEALAVVFLAFVIYIATFVGAYHLTIYLAHLIVESVL